MSETVSAAVSAEEYETETTPSEVAPRTLRTPSREDGFELRLDAMTGQMAAFGQSLEVVLAYAVVSDSNTRAIARELRLSKLATGRRVRHLRREVRIMGNRASDAAITVAEGKIKDYELKQLREADERARANATHWTRFWAEKGVGVAIACIAFLVVSLITLIVWIYAHGFR